MNRKTGKFNIVLLIVLMGMLLAGCQGKESSSPVKPTFDTTPPQIKHLTIDIDRYNAETGLAGVLDFHTRNTTGRTEKLFIEFGGMNSWGHDPIQLGTTHEWNFALTSGTKVYSPIDGVIVWTGYDPNWNDYELGIRPSENSSWAFVIDHISNIQVTDGQKIKAGDWIANAGNGTYELTLMQDKGPDADTVYCPVPYFSPELKDSFKNKISFLISDYEKYLNDNSIPISSGDGVTDPSNLYNDSAMLEPGCLVLTHKY